MAETDLNKKYICDKTGLDEKDGLVNIILDMIKDSYKSGLNQSEYDNTVCMIENNDKLRDRIINMRNNYFKQKRNWIKEKRYYIKELKYANKLINELRRDKVQMMKVLMWFKEDQQKFIKYLQEELNVQIQEESIGCEITNKRYILEEILQKYKEIIGDDNNDTN